MHIANILAPGANCMKVRDFKLDDTDDVVEILKLNDQYSPLVEGPEAVKRVSECRAAVYLVAVSYGKVVGVVKESMMDPGL